MLSGQIVCVKEKTYKLIVDKLWLVDLVVFPAPVHIPVSRATAALQSQHTSCTTPHQSINQ